jgi:hypothetical protein
MLSQLIPLNHSASSGDLVSASGIQMSSAGSPQEKIDLDVFTPQRPSQPPTRATTRVGLASHAPSFVPDLAFFNTADVDEEGPEIGEDGTVYFPDIKEFGTRDEKKHKVIESENQRLLRRNNQASVLPIRRPHNALSPLKPVQFLPEPDKEP